MSSINPNLSGNSLQLFELDSKLLPNNVFLPAFVLPDMCFNVKDKNGQDKLSFCIALISQLKNEGKTKKDVIDDGRIAILQIENGAIKSITIQGKYLNAFNDHNLKNALIKVDNRLLIVKDNFRLRTYESDSEYESVTNKL